MFSLSVPIQCIFIGLQTPEVPKLLDPRTPVFYTNDVYGTFFFGFLFLILSIVFSLYSSNLLASNNAKFPVLFES